MLIFYIPFILDFIVAQQCTQAQFYGNISDSSSFVPVQSMESYFTQQFSLPDFNNYTNILVTPKYVSYTITQNNETYYDVAFTLNLQFTFALTTGTLGQAYMENVVVSTQVIFISESQWTQYQSISITGPTQVDWLGFQVYQTLYTNLLNQFNSNISQSLTTYYQALTLTYPAMPSSFTYTYTNIQNQQQTVNLNVTSINMTYSNGVIQYAYFYVEDYDNNVCEDISSIPTSSQPQYEIISSGTLQSIFNYAFQNGYFNAILNNNWKSSDAQFIVGSAQNIIQGLKGNYPQNESITGNCTCQQASLNVKDSTNLSVQLNQSCLLDQLNSSLTQPLITFNLTLNLTIQIEERTGMLYFISKNPVLTQLIYTGGSNRLVMSYHDLARLYVRSVIDKAFNNTEVFGSGFLTIPRQNPVIELSTEQLVIYDSNQII